MLKNETIEAILLENKDSLGKHFEMYKNHVYRVFHLCQKLDENPANIEKYAIAAAFHDIGIWTASTFDYLDPSIALASAYLAKNNNGESTEEISLMIDLHHKRSKYKGPYSSVETFRRADWIDVTRGRMQFKLSKETITEVSKTFPNIGFHKFLVLQTLKQFFKSPLNPLPMFRK